MADNLNESRAIRLTEIMQDFRTLQYRIAQIRAALTADEFFGQGYVLLRECAAEGQAILQRPFAPSPRNDNGDPELVKAELKVIILDASARRFQAQRIYLKVTAAMRWINSRNSILAGAREGPQHAAVLAQVDDTLANELASITDERTILDLNSTDASQNKWMTEEPSLAAIRQWIARHQ